MNLGEIPKYKIIVLSLTLCTFTVSYFDDNPPYVDQQPVRVSIQKKRKGAHLIRMVGISASLKRKLTVTLFMSVRVSHSTGDERSRRG